MYYNKCTLLLYYVHADTQDYRIRSVDPAQFMLWLLKFSLRKAHGSTAKAFVTLLCLPHGKSQCVMTSTHAPQMDQNVPFSWMTGRPRSTPLSVVSLASETLTFSRLSILAEIGAPDEEGGG